MSLGKKIKEIRTMNTLTQQEFSKSIGISRPHLSKIESDKENASESVLKLICKIYNVDYDWLTSEDDNSMSFNIDVSKFEENIKKNKELKIGKYGRFALDVLNIKNVKTGSRKYYINNIGQIFEILYNFYNREDIKDCNYHDIEILGAYIEKKMYLAMEAFKTQNLDFNDD